MEQKTEARPWGGPRKVPGDSGATSGEGVLLPGAYGAAAAGAGRGAIAGLVAEDFHLGVAHGAGGRDPVQRLRGRRLEAVPRQGAEDLAVGFRHALEGDAVELFVDDEVAEAAGR